MRQYIEAATGMHKTVAGMTKKHGYNGPFQPKNFSGLGHGHHNVADLSVVSSDDGSAKPLGIRRSPYDSDDDAEETGNYSTDTRAMEGESEYDIDDDIDDDDDDDEIGITNSYSVFANAFAAPAVGKANTGRTAKTRFEDDDGDVGRNYNDDEDSDEDEEEDDTFDEYDVHNKKPFSMKQITKALSPSTVRAISTTPLAQLFGLDKDDTTTPTTAIGQIFAFTNTTPATEVSTPDSKSSTSIQDFATPDSVASRTYSSASVPPSPQSTTARTSATVSATPPMTQNVNGNSPFAADESPIPLEESGIGRTDSPDSHGPSTPAKSSPSQNATGIATPSADGPSTQTTVKTPTKDEGTESVVSDSILSGSTASRRIGIQRAPYFGDVNDGGMVISPILVRVSMSPQGSPSALFLNNDDSTRVVNTSELLLNGRKGYGRLRCGKDREQRTGSRRRRRRRRSVHVHPSCVAQS